LLKLIKIELKKLRRRPFILLAAMAAIILPVPISVLAAKTGQGYDFLFKTVINIGHFVLLIPVLCIVSAMLFLEERDNNTLKALLTIPVSSNKLVGAKLFILLVISVLFSIFAYVATLCGSFAGQMQVEQIGSKLLISIIMGVMTWVASLPCIAVVVGLSKNYIFSVLISFVYAILGFIITSSTLPQAIPNLLMIFPVNVINRWLIPYFQELQTADYPFDIAPCIVNTPLCVMYLMLYTVVCSSLICYNFKRWEQ